MTVPAHPLIVITHLPDEAAARILATQLIEQHLAACINLMPPCRSIYHWRGTVEESTEIPLFIKTSTARYAALESAIRTHHPYELPEIVAIPITTGLTPYLDWIMAETSLTQKC